jgi:hypothetical protein
MTTIELNNVNYFYIEDSGTASVESSPNATGNVTILDVINVSGLDYTVTEIRANAFRDLTSLTSLTIPSSITTIPNGAVQGCTNLTSVYFLGDIPTIDNNNFTINGDTAYYVTGAANISRLSPRFTTTVEVVPIPTAPTITSVNSVSVTRVNPTVSISLTQSPADSTITNYSWSIDGTTYTPLSPAQTSDTLTIPATGLTSGSSYTFSIKAINTDGSSSASNGVSSTFYLPLVAPTITSVNSVSVTSVNPTVSISLTQSPADSTIQVVLVIHFQLKQLILLVQAAHRIVFQPIFICHP